MNGFDERPISPTHRTLFTPLLGDRAREMTKADFERRVWHAKDKRALHVRAFALRLAATWASLWRRPGSAIPKSWRATLGRERAVGPV